MNSTQKINHSRPSSLIKLAALIVAIFYLSSCSHHENQLTLQKTIITGQVVGHEFEGGNNTVEFYKTDILSRPQEKMISFDKTGNFRWETALAHTHAIQMYYYGELFDLLLHPGDSIHLIIDAKELKDGEFSWEKFYSSYSVTGTSEEINRELMKFMRFYNEEVDEHDRDIQFMGTATVKQYPSIVKEQTHNQTRKLEEHFSKHNYSKELEEWAFRKIKFNSWFNLVYFPIYNSFATGIDIYDYMDSMPSSYFDFLNDWDMDNISYLDNWEYLVFLGDYFTINVIMAIPEDSLVEYRKDLVNKGRRVYDAQVRVVNREMTGFVKDIFLAKIMHQNIAQENYEFLTYTDYTNLIEDPYINSRINSEIKSMRTRYEEIQQGYTQSILEKDTHDHLLQRIQSKHPDKTLYINIWSPSCEPCLMQVPYSNAIKEDLAEMNVDLIFLANNCGEDGWQKAIEAHNIQGDHYRLTKVQYGELSEHYNIKGDPHYIIIDKDGKIIDSYAPRPENMEGLMQKLLTTDQK